MDATSAAADAAGGALYAGGADAPATDRTGGGTDLYDDDEAAREGGTPAPEGVRPSEDDAVDEARPSPPPPCWDMSLAVEACRWTTASASTCSETSPMFSS